MEQVEKVRSDRRYFRSKARWSKSAGITRPMHYTRANQLGWSDSFLGVDDDLNRIIRAWIGYMEARNIGHCLGVNLCQRSYPSPKK